MWLQLDPTEGPNRERRRMVQVPKNIPNRFLLQQQAGPEEAGGWAGLEWWVGRVRVVGGWMDGVRVVGGWVGRQG